MTASHGQTMPDSTAPREMVLVLSPARARHEATLPTGATPERLFLGRAALLTAARSQRGAAGSRADRSAGGRSGAPNFPRCRRLVPGGGAPAGRCCRAGKRGPPRREHVPQGTETSGSMTVGLAGRRVACEQIEGMTVIGHLLGPVRSLGSPE